MLDVARLENDRLELKHETIDLFQVAVEQVNEIRPTAGEHNIALLGSAGRALVAADRSRVGTIIFNLLDNAIKYSPGGRKVEVEVGCDDVRAFVTVRDQGIGIAPEHFALLFERFARLPTAENNRIPGTGLALYLCRQIARRYGGDVTVKSQPAVGSEFTLSLPALAQPAKTP
jgi:signal transduction histidine kinase